MATPEFPVEPSRIVERYRDFASEVGSREAAVSNSLPVEEPFGVSSAIVEASNRWERGEKSLRTTPVLNTYHRVAGGFPVDEVLPVLLGLDANINALDDIIDTREPGQEEKIGLTISTAFATCFAFQHVPTSYRDDVVEHYYNYLVKLFQIPLVEQRLLQQFQESDDVGEKVGLAEEIYRYRAMDIEIFSLIPAFTVDLSEKDADRVQADLRNYRARRLLFKDIADVERDLRDGDHTPVLALVTGSRDLDQAALVTTRILDSFQYSPTGEEEYGDILRALEGRPGDIREELASKQRLDSQI